MKRDAIGLSFSEIAMVNSCGGAATSNYIHDTLSKWELKDNGLIVVVMDTHGHAYDWTKEPYVFLIPKDGEELVKFLSDLSLNHYIMCLKDDDYEYKVYVDESRDGTTNIDADVLDSFLDAFKRG